MRNALRTWTRGTLRRRERLTGGLIGRRAAAVLAAAAVAFTGIGVAPAAVAAGRAIEMRVKNCRVRLASGLKMTCTIFLFGSSLILTGCSGAAGMTADDFASQVSTTVEKNINVGAEVDCGTGAIELEVGTTTECFITDPESSGTFRADVEITSVGDDKQLELKLSVDSEAM